MLIKLILLSLLSTTIFVNTILFANAACCPDFQHTYGGATCQQILDLDWCTADGNEGATWISEGYPAMDSFVIDGCTAFDCPQCGCVDDAAVETVDMVCHYEAAGSEVCPWTDEDHIYDEYQGETDYDGPRTMQEDWFTECPLDPQDALSLFNSGDVNCEADAKLYMEAYKADYQTGGSKECDGPTGGCDSTDAFDRPTGTSSGLNNCGGDLDVYTIVCEEVRDCSSQSFDDCENGSDLCRYDNGNSVCIEATIDWQVGTWSSCSASCDGGYQFRIIGCRSTTGSYESEDMCTEEKPADSQECGLDACPVTTPVGGEDCKPLDEAGCAAQPDSCRATSRGGKFRKCKPKRCKPMTESECETAVHCEKKMGRRGDYKKCRRID